MTSLGDEERKLLGIRSRELIARWPLDRFVDGVVSAIQRTRGERRGFRSWGDRLLLALWKGRYRPV
jgi:hypothetical protein